MKSFSVRGNSQHLADWLSDYLSDPLYYKSTQSNNYKTLKIPVRILWGDHDTLTPPELGRQLNGLVPGSRLYVLKDVGHIPMIEDREQLDKTLFQVLTE